MNDEHLHTNSLNDKSKQFFSRGKIDWQKSDNEIWESLEQKIQEEPERKTISLFPIVLKYAAAAVLFLLVGIASLTLFYSKTIESSPGERQTASLPDGSFVELNAGSTLKYYPVKWRFERKLYFEGEGFFDVQKGKKFEVESENGKTTVLGTTFNIYSRDDKYRVTCLSGKVKVTSKSEESVTLEPNAHVEIEKGKILFKQKKQKEEVIGWKTGMFDFRGTPLKEVIDEIERQFAVTIQLQPKLNDRNATLIFTNKFDVEEVLDFVCKTMQIKFVKQSENVFLVVENS